MTKIEWTHGHGKKGETWNPVLGCRRVSPGCQHCYAETVAASNVRKLRALAATPNRTRTLGLYEQVVKMDANGEPLPRWNGRAIPAPDRLDQPLRWEKPRMVFVNSMSDLFHDDVSDQFILDVYFVMSKARRHTFQVLTKRPNRALALFQKWQRDGQTLAEGCTYRVGTNVSPPNVWLGVSVENQATADERIPKLLQCPAAVRWVSLEPQLEQVDLMLSSAGGEKWNAVGLDWVVVGGESGKDARPFNVAWARQIVTQCADAGVACFVKQLGARPVHDGTEYPVSGKGGDPNQWPSDLRVREWPS